MKAGRYGPKGCRTSEDGYVSGLARRLTLLRNNAHYMIIKDSCSVLIFLAMLEHHASIFRSCSVTAHLTCHRDYSSKLPSCAHRLTAHTANDKLH